MDFASILGIVSLVISIAAILIVLVFERVKQEQKITRIEIRLDKFNQSADQLLEKSSIIMHELNNLKVDTRRIQPTGFNIIVSKQWRFIEQIFHYRFEKHIISKKISMNYINDRMRVLLDSGSTIDLVAAELLENDVKDVHVYSNNVYAAMHLVGTNQVNFHLFGGHFSERFAAVYSNETNNLIDTLDPDLLILAASAFRFEQGIMVHSDDIDNIDFKKTALRAFRRSQNGKLLIAVDPSKFFESIEERRGVIDSDEWQEIISEAASRIVIVTSPSPLNFNSKQQTSVATEISKYKKASVQVDDSELTG